MKKIIAFAVSVIMILSLCSCSSGAGASENKTDSYGYEASDNIYNENEYDSSDGGYSSSTTKYDVKDDVDDWMKDQAEGKDYGSGDGGTYYCMGKNDTCPNKTHNAYDLYCSSCDPDGDNIEG